MEGPSSVAPAEAYDQVLRLERHLLAASKSKGPFDPAVRRLRTMVRDGFEALILRDLSLSEAFEVEQALWSIHYQEIENFRGKIGKLLMYTSPAEGNAVTTEHRKKRKKDNKEEALLRALMSFRSFLREAEGFFHGLLIKLRLQYGLASPVGNRDRFSAEEDMTEELHRCIVTCHRILIYLGDLARYKELYTVMDESTRDWSVAANYYKQAAVLYPSRGNPYNQLAVLCMYCGNSLTALYFYCRSIAVSVPFETAFDNVGSLCKKNKQDLSQGVSLHCDKKVRREINLPTNLHSFVIEQDSWSINKVARCESWFPVLFIEFVRVLLVESSMDELEKAVDALEGRIEEFLCDKVHDVKAWTTGSIPLSLQVMTVLIFCMHQKIGQSDNGIENILESGLKIALKLCILLAEKAGGGQWSAFPVTVVLMEWLASQPKALQVTCNEKAVAAIFSEFCERVTALDFASVWNDIVGDRQPNSELTGRNDVFRLAEKAQWEDHELLGFVPLAASHLRLDFYKKPPSYGVLDLVTYSCWKLRFRDALQKAWTSFEQSNSGCLLKFPDLGNIELPIDASNPIPSLKDWIDRTFFPGDMVTDSVHTKRMEAPNHRHQQVDLSGHDHATSDSGDNALMNSEMNVELALHNASMDIVTCSHEETSGQRKPILMEEQQELRKGTGMQSDVLEDKALDISTREAPVEPYAARRSGSAHVRSGSPNQCLVMTRVDYNSLGLEKSFSSKTNQCRVETQEKMSAFLHDQELRQNVLCFDNITHSRPQVLAGAISKSLSELVSWNSKAYETRNPFFLRLRKKK